MKGFYFEQFTRCVDQKRKYFLNDHKYVWHLRGCLKCLGLHDGHPLAERLLHIQHAGAGRLAAGILRGDGEASRVLVKHFGDVEGVPVTLHGDLVVLGYHWLPVHKPCNLEHTGTRCSIRVYQMAMSLQCP